MIGSSEIPAGDAMRRPHAEGHNPRDKEGRCGNGAIGCGWFVGDGRPRKRAYIWNREGTYMTYRWICTGITDKGRNLSC